MLAVASNNLGMYGFHSESRFVLRGCMLKRLFSVMALVLSFAGAPAAAQVFDFSVQFSGNAASTFSSNTDVYNLSGRLTFDGNGNIDGFEPIRLFNQSQGTTFTSSLTSGSVTGTYNEESLALNALGFNASFREDGLNYTINIDYPFSVAPGVSRLQVSTSFLDPITNNFDSGSTTLTSYTLGEVEFTINDDGTSVSPSGQIPVESVPEINGGTLPLLAFILSVLAMMLYMRNPTVTRNSGLTEHRTLSAQST
jgi:hypothetical protein